MSRASILVARTEFRRTVRAVSSERTKLALMALLALIMIGSVTVAGGYLLPRLGAAFADGVGAESAALATETVTGGVAIGWLFLTFMATLRTFSAAADPDEPAFLLVSTSLRNAIVGIVGAEIGLFGVWLLPPTLLLAGAFAYGAGTIVPILVAPFVAALVLVTAVPVGFVLGVWIRYLVTVYEPIARYRVWLFAAFWLCYFGSIATGVFNPVVGRLFAALQGSPLGWPGHILLYGVPNVAASSAAVVGAIAGATLVSTAAFAVGIASARVHWFADPARFDDEEERSRTESSDRLAGVLDRGIARPTRTVAVTAIRRTRRAPIRLAYVGYPLFGALGFVQEIVQSRTVPAFVAVLLSLYVVWAAGALFTLNPLGDLGRALPAVVTSTLTGRQAIGGLVVAGALVAAPLGFLVSLVLGVVSPLSLERTLVLVAVTTVGAAVTPALATGIGTAAPRYGTVNVTRNREAVMPSKTAFVVYSIAIVLPTIAAAVVYTDSPDRIADLIATVSALLPGPAVSVSARGIAVAAWTVLVVGLAAPPVSFQYAVERFDWYALE